MYLWLYHNAPKKIYCIFSASQSIIALCKFILLLDFCGFSIDYISENVSGIIAVFETNSYVRLCIIPLSEASVTVPNELSEKKLCWRVYGNDLFHLRIRFFIACGIWTRESLYESVYKLFICAGSNDINKWQKQNLYAYGNYWSPMFSRPVCSGSNILNYRFGSFIKLKSKKNHDDF